MQEPSFSVSRSSASVPGLAALGYLLLLIYGTLYPLNEWQTPPGGFFPHFLDTQLSDLPSADLITNVLVYIPAGLLLTTWLLHSLRWSHALCLAVTLGTSLNFTLETLQVFLPSRTSALSDLLLNSIGTVMGATLALLLSGRTRWGQLLHDLYRHAILPGTVAQLGLVIIALWALSQLSPLVPSLTLSQLRDGLKPLWLTVSGQQTFLSAQSLVYLCEVFALGSIFLTLSRSRLTGLLLFSLFTLAVLILKIPIVGRQLSLEAMMGSAAGLFLLSLLHRRSVPLLLTFAGSLLLCAFFIDGLRSAGYSTAAFAFNWIPFRGHMQNIIGLANILASAWVFMALGYIVRQLCQPSQARHCAWLGLLLVGLLASTLEYLQQSIPGRFPDITDIVIAVSGWACAWVGADQKRFKG